MKTTLATIALSVVVLALPAVAQKPTITETPFTTFTITGGPAAGACAFDVLLTPQTGRPNKEKTITFSNGTQMVTGALFLTLENLTTHKTVNLNASGPGTTTFSGGIPTSFVARGPVLVFNVVPTSISTAAGLPAVALTDGRLVFTFDAQGNLTALNLDGHSQDVCQMLE
jgi:hypothetical protein